MSRIFFNLPNTIKDVFLYSWLDIIDLSALEVAFCMRIVQTCKIPLTVEAIFQNSAIVGNNSLLSSFMSYCNARSVLWGAVCL